METGLYSFIRTDFQNSITGTFINKFPVMVHHIRADLQRHDADEPSVIIATV